MSKAEEYGMAAHRVLQELQDYWRDSETGTTHTLLQREPPDIARDLDLASWIRNGGMDAETMGTWLAAYLNDSQHLHAPGFIGHQVASPHPGAAIADMVHGAINNPMAVYEMGPAASVIERIVVNWMLEKAGWGGDGQWDDMGQVPGRGAGVLTHGGSLANLTATLAARAHAAPQSWQAGVPDNLVVMAPAATHYSMARSVSIAGLGKDALIPVAVDAHLVFRPECLETEIATAHEAGKRVMMVSCNACTTATGLYDPIDEIADICEAHDIWLHVDGAHGASALLSENERHLLKGVNRAHSLIWDAHKMMRTSALCAAVLFRKPEYLTRTFSQSADYIFYGDDQPGFDVGPFAIECTKAALGVKLFMVLAMEGEAGMGDFVHGQYVATREFHDLIEAQDDFSCLAPPQSNILCFRYLPIADNAAQQALRTALIARGNFYVTSAEVSGTRYLRLAVMNPLTDTDTIRVMLDEIRDVARGLA